MWSHKMHIVVRRKCIMLHNEFQLHHILLWAAFYQQVFYSVARKCTKCGQWSLAYIRVSASPAYMLLLCCRDAAIRTTISLHCMGRQISQREKKFHQIYVVPKYIFDANAVQWRSTTHLGHNRSKTIITSLTMTLLPLNTDPLFLIC